MAIKGSARADLHTHTHASDGTGAPADNVRLAQEAGLAAIAITDHDTVAGIEEALAAGEQLGVQVVPGVELSTVAEGIDIHILGYWIDWRNERWLERLSTQRDTRDVRNAMIIAKLCELGMPITMDEVLEEAGRGGHGDRAIGRPHLAGVLLRKGYVATMAEAFDRYLGSDGAAYVNPPRLSPFDALTWIREAGGAAVIAHPGLYDRDALVERLLEAGADGIEVFHSDHGAEEEERYGELARRYGVIATGGSDYHGVRNGVVFHGHVGSRTVDIAAVEQLRQAGLGRRLGNG
jgi:3',5'-nucleoside bisphosphate phosphatase